MLIDPLSVHGCPEGVQLDLDSSEPVKVNSIWPLVAACPELVQLLSEPLMVKEPLALPLGEPPPASSTSVARPRASLMLVRLWPAGSPLGSALFAVRSEL